MGAHTCRLPRWPRPSATDTHADITVHGAYGVRLSIKYLGPVRHRCDNELSIKAKVWLYPLLVDENLVRANARPARRLGSHGKVAKVTPVKFIFRPSSLVVLR